MDKKKLVPIIRYSKGKVENGMDDVLMEYILSISINNKPVVRLICLPEALEELVLGYLFTEGVIDKESDVLSIDIDAENGWGKVQLKTVVQSGVGKFTTDSGDFVEIPYQFNVENMKTLPNILWEPEVVMKNAALLLNQSELFKTTGNVHSVMLCEQDKVLCFFEDIGRYNAFDKCVGKALKDGIDLGKTTIYTSGRIPSSIALKAIRSGIPMIVSRSAPTDTTIEVACKYHLTVIGFAREQRMNVYVQ